MRKLKKTVVVAAMVGGMGLLGGGVAYAGDGYEKYAHSNKGGYGNDDPFDVIIGNLQAVECEQPFDAAAVALTGGAAQEGDNQVGNNCTVIGAISD